MKAWTGSRPTPASPRAVRLASVVAGVLGGLVVAELVIQASAAIRVGNLGMDFLFYRDTGARWLADGTYYLSHQLAGPYALALMVDVLYPPTALYLFVPLAVVPTPFAAVAWWLVPLAVLVYAATRWRPGPIALVGALLLFLWPRAVGALVFGNTDMVMAAGMAGGLLWGWPVILLALKPTLAPMGLPFLRDRRARRATVILTAASLPTLALWFDYVAAMRNIIDMDPGYSIGSLPLLLVPVALWAGRTRHRSAPR